MPKNRLILVSFAAAVICILLVKPLLTGQGNTPNPSAHSLAEAGEAIGRQPVLIVFTYNGDCCDSTRQFFDDYNRRVESIAGPFGTQVTVIWADASIEAEPYRQNLEDLARRYSVRRLPSCLVIDAAGQAVGIIEGVPDDERLRNTIARAVNDG